MLFLAQSFWQPLKKASGEILNKKNLVKPQQPGNSFPTLSVVQAEQTNKNRKFGSFACRLNCSFLKVFKI